MDGGAAALHTIDAPIIDVLLGSTQFSCRAQHVRHPFCSLLNRGYVRHSHDMTPARTRTSYYPRESSEWLPMPHKLFNPVNRGGREEIGSGP
jgi:hypothetical protein